MFIKCVESDIHHRKQVQTLQYNDSLSRSTCPQVERIENSSVDFHYFLIIPSVYKISISTPQTA